MPDPSEQPARTADSRTLTEKTARGFVYLLAQSLANLVIGAGQQIALAWLLTDADFGLFGMAVAVNAVALILQFSGLREVLIQRYRHFRRWANAGFWLSLTIGLVGASLLAALSEVAAWWYETRDVIPLVLVMAATLPLGSLSVVPEAQLRGQLRFRAIAAVDCAWLAAIAVMSVVFAFLGAGAMSFVWPRPLADLLRSGAMWWFARPPVRLNLQIRRWKYLLPDSIRLLAASFVELGVEVGDALLLGRFHTKQVVGVYYFAYAMARRPLGVLQKSVGGVLFPALSTLQADSARQISAFLRAVRLQAYVSVPAGVLGMALADPAIHVLFPARWIPAIDVLQITSIGMILKVPGWSSRSLLKAQGRFGTYLLLGIAYTAMFLVLVAVTAWRAAPEHAAVDVAMAAVACFLVMEPAIFYAAIKPAGGRWYEMLALHGRPLLLSVASIGPAWGLAQLVPACAIRDWIRIAVILCISMPLYAVLTRWLASDVWNEVGQRIRGFMRTR